NNNNNTIDSQKVIGAQFSHIDLMNNDHSHHRTTSPDRRSINSNNSSSTTPRPSLTFTKSKKWYGGESSSSKNNKKVYDDDDWNDDIDDLVTPISPEKNDKDIQFYPSIDDLKIDDNNIGNLEPSLMAKNEVDNEQEEEEEEDTLYPFLKPNYEDIVRDPYSILTTQVPPLGDTTRYNKIVKALTKQPFELQELKKQSWSGIPNSIRSLVWQVLLGYVATNSSTREQLLNRKRKEYINSMTQLFQNEKDQTIWHQITIDIPRTSPSIKLYSFETTQRSLEKILYLWAIRHPASGYVQGINDLCTPFYQIFLNHYLKDDIEVENFDPKVLPKELINAIEADTYWCLTKVLDTIQDNYIHEQPGIIRQVNELRNLVKRDEPFLAQHFENEGIDFIQFSFRWMNCMLMRELKLPLIIRMWDTYISNFPTGFNQFHVYVCCAFLRRFSDELLDMDFQDMIIFLQDSSKTNDWNEDDVEMMLSEAFVWQSLYENATAHLK
ncbi:hypothetical protein CANARDRAFT_199783, partial [[Candida] arabinofermentans NRRL YB-2248]